MIASHASDNGAALETEQPQHCNLHCPIKPIMHLLWLPISF
jgi:hypothetical protein